MWNGRDRSGDLGAASSEREVAPPLYGGVELLDRHRLTFRFQGRDYRLTDVHGELVEGILA